MAVELNSVQRTNERTNGRTEERKKGNSLGNPLWMPDGRALEYSGHTGMMCRGHLEKEFQDVD